MATGKRKTKTKKDKKVAYTPLSEKEKEAAMKRLIKGLKDGSIKAPLPSDLQGPHYRIPKA